MNLEGLMEPKEWAVSVDLTRNLAKFTDVLIKQKGSEISLYFLWISWCFVEVSTSWISWTKCQNNSEIFERLNLDHVGGHTQTPSMCVI